MKRDIQASKDGKSWKNLRVSMIWRNEDRKKGRSPKNAFSRQKTLEKTLEKRQRDSDGGESINGTKKKWKVGKMVKTEKERKEERMRKCKKRGEWKKRMEEFIEEKK